MFIADSSGFLKSVAREAGMPHGVAEETTFAATRFRYLALAIIHQAFLDAAGEKGLLGIGKDTDGVKARRTEIVREARAWLTNDSPCLRLVCDVAQVSASRVIKRARGKFPHVGLEGVDEQDGGDTTDRCMCGLRREFLDRLFGRENLRRVPEKGRE